MIRTNDKEVGFSASDKKPNTLPLTVLRINQQAKQRNTPIEHADRLPNGAIPLAVASRITIPSRYFAEYGQFGLDGLMTGLEYIARTEAMMADYPVLKPYCQDEIQDQAVDAGFADLSVIKTQCQKSQIDIADYQDVVRSIYNGAPKAWINYFSADMTTPASKI